jgi:hypothetical protein
VCKIDAHAIKPHKIRYYLERRDPEFEEKMAHVPCIYREIAILKEAAVVVCSAGGGPSSTNPLGVAYRLAGKFLDAEVTMLDASRWRRKFVFAERLQGIAWAAVVWLVSQSGDPAARSYALVLLLLVGAMNATISAPIPSAVAGTLTP